MTVRPRTRYVHGGAVADPTGAVVPPIHTASTYRQAAPGEHAGYEYARVANPTRDALERLVAEIEGGTRALAFASGMAAIACLLAAVCEAGDHVVVSDDVYGGTYRVLDRVFSRLGVAASFVDTRDPARVEAALTPRTRLVLVETPTNPLLRVADLPGIVEVCRRRGVPLAVDGTFLSPHFLRPLELGADVSIQSGTKYLGGHSDLLAGTLAVRDPELGERLHFVQKSTGGVLSPFDAWLLMRGIRTLALRMEAHQQGALRVAAWLAHHPRVRRVFYPGLPDDPGHRLLRTYASGFGGMVSFEAESPELAARLLRRVRIFTLAESLGGVESLICLPARMTHASLPPERRAELGISDALIRLSVGIEDPDDLIADLAQAMGDG